VPQRKAAFRANISDANSVVLRQAGDNLTRENRFAPRDDEKRGPL
jgi:hypothetical protein